MFNTTGIKEGGKYVRPGINTVTIDSIKGVEPENSTSYLSVNFKLPTSDATTEVRLYMGKGQEISLDKLTHIATKVVKRKELDAIQADNIITYGDKINKLLSNKTLRIKFIAKEYINASGEIKTKPELPRKFFAEAVIEGGEEAPVLAQDSSLTYDIKNPYDYVKLPNTPEANGEIIVTGDSKNDGLPF